MPSCVAKQVTGPVRNREAPVTGRSYNEPDNPDPTRDFRS
jgi:hypothetical protein